MPNSLYNFQYTPLTGRLPGKSFVSQTEQAINGLAQYVYENSTNYEAVKAIAQKAEDDSSAALEYSEEALDKAQTALETVGRAYIKTTSVVDLNNYFDSELLYITNVESANLPADTTGYLTVMSTDSHDYCMQVYICDSGDVYKRSATIADSIPTFGAWSETPITISVLQPLLNALANANASNIGINADTDNSIAWGNAIGGGEIANDEQRLITGGTVYPLSQSVARNASNIAINTADIVQNTGDISANSKRITNIEKLLQGNLYDYDTDDDTAYTKTVPSGALPYSGLEKLGGKTIVWNQTFDTSILRNDGTAVGVTSKKTENGIRMYGTFTDRVYYAVFRNWCPTVGHTYLVTGTPLTDAISLRITQNGSSVPWNENTPFVVTDPQTSYTIISASLTFEYFDVTWTPQIFDLTLMFGAGNEPSTYEEFQQMFPSSYYPYNAGTLLSAGVTEVVSKGANLIPTYTTSGSENGLTWTVSEDGSITINGTATDGTPILAPISSWQWDGRTPCWLSGCPNGGSTNSYFLDIYGEDEWGSYQLSKEDTGNGVALQSNLYLDITNIPLRFRIVIISGTQCNNLTFKPILNYGTSAKSYAPYVGTIANYPIPASIQALEGYGWSAGSAYNYIDYERKVFVKCVSGIDLGSLTWVYQSENTRFYTSALSGVIKAPTSNSNKANLINQKYITNSYQSYTDNQACATVTGDVFIKDSSYTDASSFKSALSGVYAYYELATPQEIDISAYLTDDNLISVEAGGTLTFPNQNGTDYQIPVPSEETYMIDLQSAIGG